MKPIYSLLLALLILLFFAINSYANETRYARWSKEHMPLKVYIQKKPALNGEKNNYSVAITKALAEWKNKTNGLVSFIIINDSNAADIQFYMQPKIKKEDYTDQASGHSYVWGVTKLGNPTKITLTTYHPLNNNQPLSDYNIYLIALHEVGHALGMWWHTRDPRSIMYPEFIIPTSSSNGNRLILNKNKGTLSPTDIQNLINLYNKNQVTLIDKIKRNNSLQLSLYNASGQNNTITTGTAAASVTNKTTDLNLSIGIALNHLKENPNSYEAYNNLGIIYLESNNYDLAARNFLKAICINPQNPLPHFNLGLTCVKMKKYTEAINEYQKYLELAPTASNTENVQREITRLKSLN